MQHNPALQELDLSDLPPKQAAFAILRDNGLKCTEAAKVLGYTNGSAYHVNGKIQKRYSLTNRKLVKSAHQVVKNILAGEPWGAVTDIKASSSLMAAQMVYDRCEPVKRGDDVPSSVSFTQVNLYLSNENKLPLPSVIDVEPCESSNDR